MNSRRYILCKHKTTQRCQPQPPRHGSRQRRILYVLTVIHLIRIQHDATLSATTTTTWLPTATHAVYTHSDTFDMNTTRYNSVSHNHNRKDGGRGWREE